MTYDGPGSAFSFMLFFISVLLKAGAQDTCAEGCGTSLTSCSCQVTCESLGTCCSDFWEFCLNISPYSGTLLGGKDFTALNVTFSAPYSVKCRFDGETETSGYVAEDGRVHCISPLLYLTGMVSLEISQDDGQTFPWSGTWLSVHHNKVPPSEKSTLVNETKWQYYGTPGTGGNLTVSWNHQMLQANYVNIEVWGYNETGKPYSSNWAAEWKYLYTLKRNHSNIGEFTFLPVPSAQYRDWELGALRISSSAASDGQSNVAAIWSTEHALAWHLGDDFRRDSAAWATEKCHQWDARERDQPNFLDEIEDCPCTLAQARADTGRFHTDYGCDIEKGSVCTYHQGAVHCVRSVQASPQYAAGQQCCYDAAGTQVLTGDSIGGSTPDRGHDWGAPPYKKPPRVPGFSHWIYDVLSFYYCCLWSDNCSIYFKHRPSSGCRRYRPPRAASAFGDPHFITFDGMNFTFKGLGEYTLVESDLTWLRIQGRTQLVKLLSGKEGLFLSTAPGLNVTVMFSSGAGVEVSRWKARSLSLTVLLPEKFQNHLQGLFGNINGNPRDDLTLRNGTSLHTDFSTPEDIFVFGADWAIRNETSLFTYDTQHLLDKYFYGPKHDPTFLPVFTPSEDPTDPLVEQMAFLCQSDPFCRFDVLTTRDLAVGNSTKLSHQRYLYLQESLQPVVSCGWLAPPSNGKKEGTNYLVGSVVRFHCNHGYSLAGASERMCQDNGAWSGEPTSCLPHDGSGQPVSPFVLKCGILGFAALAVALGRV
ncbi:sushi domain-containing protein 2 isoform X2 [Pogona vitticeps]